jgi:hypothetical protein
MQLEMLVFVWKRFDQLNDRPQRAALCFGWRRWTRPSACPYCTIIAAKVIRLNHDLLGLLRTEIAVSLQLFRR